MRNTTSLIKKIIELRKKRKLDPFNLAINKYLTCESSLESQFQNDDSKYLYDKVIEIIAEILQENMSEEEITEFADLQINLTNKYADKLQLMEKTIHERVEAYIDLYNEALKRIISGEEGEESSPEWKKNN